MEKDLGDLNELACGFLPIWPPVVCTLSRGDGNVGGLLLLSPVPGS